MTGVLLTYAAVTPARNEGANLRRLAACLAAQTLPPTAWVIVDDDSTDETAAIARDLAQTTPWVRAVTTSPRAEAGGAIELGRRSGRDVIAFAAGLEALETLADVVVKVDADISFGPRYFERLVGEFDADERLGIASGCAHEFENGAWRKRHVTGTRVRGASRAYRRACLEAVLPLEERLGWDVIDELEARLHGWRTRSLVELPFRHHRSVGARDGTRLAWAAQGELAHYCGYRISYLLLRALHRARSDRAALALLRGYLAAALRGEPRYAGDAVRASLREEQRLRHLGRRAREALGRA